MCERRGYFPPPLSEGHDKGEATGKVAVSSQPNLKVLAIPTAIYHLYMQDLRLRIHNVFRIYLEEGVRQWKQLSPQFIRGVFSEVILPLIEARRGLIEDELRRLITRTGRPNSHLEALKQELKESTDRVVKDWSRRAEIEARKLTRGRGESSNHENPLDSLSLEIVTLESLELSSRLDEKFEEAERKIYANPGVYPELRLDIPEKEWRPLVYREELTPGKRQPEPTSQQVIPATNKTLAQPRESKSQAANPQQGFTNSSDYRSVNLDGRVFPLSTSQAAVVQVLHENYCNGTPDVSGERLLGAAGSSGSRLRDAFKSNMEAWKALIVRSRRRGAFRLNLPEAPTPPVPPENSADSH